MPPIPPTILLIPLAVGAVLLPGSRARSIGLVASLGPLLALAALRLDGWFLGPWLAAPVTPERSAFLVATAGLFLAGVGGWVLAVREAMRVKAEGDRSSALPAALLAGLGLVPGWPLVAAAGPLRALAAGAGTVAAIALLGVLGEVTRIRRAAEVLTVPATAEPPGLRPVLPWTAGMLLVAAGPHLHVVLAGVAFLLLLGARRDLAARSPLGITADLVALVALAAAWWLLGTVAGPGAGWMSRIREIPLSPAAEYLLLPLLGTVAVRLAGVPPFSGTTGVLLVPAAWFLASRLVLPALPHALPAWTAGIVGAAALGALVAGGARRPDQLLSATAMAATLAGGRPGSLGGAVLLGGALAMASTGACRNDRAVRWLRLAMTAALAWAAGEAIAGTLATEVVYSVAIVAGGVAAAWPERG